MNNTVLTALAALLALGAAGARAESITQSTEIVVRLGETLLQPRCDAGLPAIIEAESPPPALYGRRWSAVATLVTDEIETWSTLSNGPNVQEAIAAYATSDVRVPPAHIRETILGMMKFERHDAPAWRFHAIGKPADDPDGKIWLPAETARTPQIRVRYGCVSR